MKLILIVCGQSRNREVLDLLEKHEIQGYTEVPTVVGAGVSGKHMGTRSSPGTECMLFLLVRKERADGLIQDLKQIHAELYPEEALHAFSLDAESVL